MLPIINYEDRAISKYLNLGDDDDLYISSSSSSLRLINAQGGDDDIFVNGDGRAIVYGGSGSDTISGGDGGDTLYGGSGADSLYGGGGGTSNTLYGGSGDDYASGGDGDDTIYGGIGNDTLIGDDVTLAGFGSDTIYGGSGNDTIYGGAGGDEMWGGDGADVFAYLNNLPQFNAAPLSEPDRIMDFDQAQDLIDLSGIDAIRSTNGNEQFSLVGGPSTVAGRMWIETVDGDTQRVFLNYDGGAADMMIEVNSVGGSTLSLGASDFLL